MGIQIEAQQIKFKFSGALEEMGGIAVYFNQKLMFVICGDNGGYIVDPDDIKILKIYDDWVPFSQEIIEE